MATGQSGACSLFLQQNEYIECTVSGARCYSSDLPLGGLEVPRTLCFYGIAKLGKIFSTNLALVIILISITVDEI